MPRTPDPGRPRLAEYERKRRAARTPEPFDGRPPGGGDGPIFVVQRHSATRLHYDLRLERDGVLASWAVPKGLPRTPGARRLAVHTEDHPMAYAAFEGQIPKGEYGAGTMDVYDTGPYEVVEERKDGGLTFRLHGARLRGTWTLVPAGMDRDERNWLLIRRRDDDAPGAVTAVEALRYEPMLATNADELPRGDGWLYEVKWDGYRAVARLAEGEPMLWSRNGNDLRERFQAVAVDLARGLRSPECVVDGEVCRLDEQGRPSFSRLQQGEGALVYYVFDVLEVDGEPVLERPLTERRELLERLVDETSKTVRISRTSDDGETLLRFATEHGLEGLMAKQAASTYVPGRRTRAWLKVKVRRRQELVIVGHTLGEGARERLGSLVMAFHDADGRLVYAGNVGTGFTGSEIDRLLALFAPLRRDTPPLEVPPREPRLRRGRVVWLEPELVAEVEFAEWTHDGRVRAPAYKGLRDDKDPRDVVREDVPQPAGGEPDPALAVGSRVELSNLDKVFFPRDGITKGDLVAYYREVAPVLLPHLRGRPFTMKRQPDGIDGKTFFQKNAPKHTPAWIPRAELPAEGGTRTIAYPLVEDLDALLWVVNMGAIDLHVWYSRLPQLEHPDYVLFDLDPSDDVGLPEAVQAAQLIRRLLDGLGLRSYPKTSGSEGLHVCVPLDPVHSYDDTRLFAQGVGGALERTHPGLVTTTWTKRARRGVLVDYRQNRLGATIASVYSVRPRDGAPVSCPLRWEEVTEDLDPRTYTREVVLERVARDGDLFAPVLDGGQTLERALGPRGDATGV